MFFESKKFKKIGALLITVLLPVIIIFLSMNVVTRAHDVYKYNLEHTKTLYKMDITLDGASLANNISQFMLGKSDKILTFDKNSDSYDPAAPVVSFSKNDYAKLTKLKQADNVMAVICILSILAFSFIFFVFISENDYTSKSVLRRRFLVGEYITLGVMLLCFVYAFISPVFDFINRLLGITYSSGDILNIMFTPRIVKEFVLSGMGFGLVVMLLGMYVVWQCTKPRKIF